MTTNPFFNNFDSYAEKKLIEDLIIESIRIYGIDLYYCPREVIAKNEVLGEDSLSEYNSAYLVEMYIKNVEGFEGEGDFLSKFNIQIRDEITFTVAQRVFNDDVGAEEVIYRPQEGDIIFFPLTDKVYVVKFVEHEAVFYQLGGLQTYDLRCELFEYSNEKLNTSIHQIDSLGEKYSKSFGDVVIDDETGRRDDELTYDINDPFADNDVFENKGKGFIDFSELDPFAGDEY